MEVDYRDIVQFEWFSKFRLKQNSNILYYPLHKTYFSAGEFILADLFKIELNEVLVLPLKL